MTTEGNDILLINWDNVCKEIIIVPVTHFFFNNFLIYKVTSAL